MACVYKLIYTPYKVMHRTSNVLNCTYCFSKYPQKPRLDRHVFNIKAYLIR